MKWHDPPGMSITIHYSNNYDYRSTENCKIFHIIKMKLRFQTQYQQNFNGFTCFWGPAIHWTFWDYSAIKPEVENARWRLLNLKCVYLRFQTKDINNIPMALHPCFGVQRRSQTR